MSKSSLKSSMKQSMNNGDSRSGSGHLIPEQIDYDVAPVISKKLVRLLDFLTIVGTVVKESDVFRKIKNNSNDNNSSFKKSRRPSLIQSVKAEFNAITNEETKEENSEEEDIDIGEKQTTEEELSELLNLKNKGFLTEAEYEDAKDLILIQSLDLPDDDEFEDDDINFGKMLADEGTFDERLQVVAAKYLIGVFILDSLGWAVGKMALLEVLLLADELGYSIVYVSLILASSEAAIEFFSSSIVPSLYTWMHNTDAVSSRGLVEFSVNAYFYSAGIAILAYPILGVLTQVMGIRTPTMFLTFACIQSFQYPLINQLGDQAVEMALPHWLATFDSLVLVSPGVQLIDRCKIHKACKICCNIIELSCTLTDCILCCFCWPLVCLKKVWYCLFVNENREARDEEEAFEDQLRYERKRKSQMDTRNEIALNINDDVMGSVPDGSKEGEKTMRLKSHTEWRSKWRNNLAARASSDSLAYFLNLSRFILSVIFTFIYIGCDRLGSASIRWLAIISFCSLSYYASRTMRRGFRYIQRGIKHEIVEHNHSPTPWLWEMTRAEVSLVIFSTVIFTVPSDGASAALAVLYVTLSSSVSAVVIVIGGFAVLIYLIRKLVQINELADDDMKKLREEERGGGSSSKLKKDNPSPDPFQSTSSSYFARYWTRSPEKQAAIEKRKLDEMSGDSIATFSQWIRHYMFIVLMISLSAICLYTSASFFYEPTHLIDEDKIYNTTKCHNATLNDTYIYNHTIINGTNVTLSILNQTNLTTIACGIVFWKEEPVDEDSSMAGVGLFVLSAFLLVPYYALNADLKSRFESVMFHYTEGQASGIVYYRNVFTVLLKLPVLVVNWYVLQASGISGDDDGVLSRRVDDYDDESYEAQLADEEEDKYDQQVGGIVLGVSVGVLLVALTYYVFIDPCLGDNASASKLVNRTGKKVDIAANLAASARIMAENLAREREVANEKEDFERSQMMKNSFQKKGSAMLKSSSSLSASTTYSRHQPRISSDADNQTFNLEDSIGGAL
mmetsp:Transcript_15785/g.20477  ORF Transcript_15785/g.20477 Transcript_15785/m.20477 type:complete len:1015 (-) Transcript_15785:342-3386(-)